MIVVNRIGDNITVSGRDKDYNVLYSEEKFNALIELANESQTVETMPELQALLEKVEDLCKNDYKEKIEAFHPNIYVQPASKRFYLKLNGKITGVPMPAALVRRIQESVDKDIDISPIVKCWMRFLRNEKSGIADFGRRFAEYIDMIYVAPDKRAELMEEGLSEELAEEQASTFEVKITQEGLIACYKVSQEVDWKYAKDDNGNIVKVDRYERTFDENTGKITGDSRNDIPMEDRLFIPKIMGEQGDPFYCESKNGKGFKEPGHFIKVGCTHRLPDWSYVDRNDERSCVKGLHVGGLSYIHTWGGEIHTCFVDPMHIGAIPDYSGDKAIRVLQYFVYGSFVSVNHSIYHSSDYARQTDEEWEKIAEEILKKHGEIKEEIKDAQEEIAAVSDEAEIANGLDDSAEDTNVETTEGTSDSEETSE